MADEQKVSVFLPTKVYDKIKLAALKEKISLTKWIARAAEEALARAKKAA